MDRGDPNGHRLARRRALQLGEAGRLARAVRVALARAEADTAACDDLVRAIDRRERQEWQRAAGRIESRKRFKHPSGHPLRDRRGMNLLFIDESGSSHPERHRRDAVFALGAVAMSEADATDYRAAADALKLHFFGRTDLTLHEPDMREFDGAFHFRGDRLRQRAFDAAVDDLVAQARFVAFGAAVRKTAYAEEFVAAGLDPYLPADAYPLALTLLLERYIDYLATSADGAYGRVTFESQGPREDAHHQLDYARLLVEGTRWAPESAFRNLLEAGVRFAPKRGSDPLELADMLARDIHEWVRDGCTAPPKRWATFSDKIYRREPPHMGGFGLKVFPDSDIRDRIEAHRAAVGRGEN